MKILKIEFQNINSLRGFHEIDFSKEPFITNSLFAITGPTGSGKSTILDVISLALFNHVPRLGKITKNEILAKGAILTRNQRNAMARITYQCKSGIFSSQWTIEVNRNNNLNDYDMEVHDHQSGKLLDLKKSLVPSRNEELIGLNYDQFIKAVLLAQGEFAQFLKAKKEERGELLEKITGTGIYRKLGIKAFEKNKEANLEIQQQQNEIQIIKKDLLDDATIEAKNSELIFKTSQLTKKQKEKEQLQKSIDLKINIQDHRRELEKKQTLQKTASDDLKKFELENGFPLKQHEKVQERSDELRAWNQLKKDISQIENLQEKLIESSKKNTSRKEELLQKTRNLTKKAISEDELQISLNSFRDQVLKLQELRTAKLNSYSVKKDQLNSELRDTNLKLENKKLGDFIDILKDEMKNTSEEFSDSLEKLKLDPQTDLSEQQGLQKSQLALLREAAVKFRNIEGEKKEIDRLEKEISALNAEIKNLPEMISSEKKELEFLQKDLKILILERDNVRLKASLEEHRSNLKDNEPCPLCGALHHPFALEDEHSDNELVSKIVLLEEKINKLQKQHSLNQAKYSNLEKNLNSLEEKLSNSRNKHQSLKDQFSESYKDFSSLESLDAFENSAAKMEAEIELISSAESLRKKDSALKKALPIAEELKNVIEDGKKVAKELEKLYSGKDIQDETLKLSNTWSSLQQEDKTLEERKSEIKNSLKRQFSELEDSEKLLKDFTSEKGFENIEAAWNVLMPESEASKLRNEQQQIIKKIEENQAAAKLLTTQLEKMLESDLDTSLEQLNSNLQECTELYKKLDDERIQLKQELGNQEERVKKMNCLQKEIAEKEQQTRRWRLLNELIGDSKGKSFNDFAQDLTLSRLINLANVRLQDLSDRYILDKPTEEEDEGLVAIDEHMGGQRRSVKTLSGGETFILSLSMALALSDLASKNVEINSLFIDEGFGTLDPETLDQTLDTLEKLQAESSKTIGIISHVDSLKERITTQIQLTRNGQGYSSLVIK